MAILDNFEVTILTLGWSSPNSRTTCERVWKGIVEHSPPGSEIQKSSYNTCRRYIGVPPLQNLEQVDRVSTEFVIDYKVRCGFVFPDQHDTGVEYIVFRTYLDDEKIGSAKVDRKRWEQSGTYRVRKQGKRYRVENEQRWIRQRWMFDPGLHGTIKVEIWRERTKIPAIDIWGFIDLTGDDDVVVGQQDLSTIAYESNAKRPRIKHTTKLDLLPIATFEFEYRSTETLRLLGLTETEPEAPEVPQGTDQLFTEENNELWRTMTSTSSSGGTIDTMMDTLLNDMDPRSQDFQMSYMEGPAQDLLQHSINYTDAIGRSLLTGTKVPTKGTAPMIGRVDPSTATQDGKYADAIPNLDGNWWAECNTPVKSEETQRFSKADLVDLTMLD